MLVVIADNAMSVRNSTVTATVNSNVTLTCPTMTGDTVRWIRYREGPSAPLTLFSGSDVNPKFPRIRVNTLETGHNELIIHNVQYKDAGQYSCKVTSPSYFTLTVIG